MSSPEGGALWHDGDAEGPSHLGMFMGSQRKNHFHATSFAFISYPVYSAVLNCLAKIWPLASKEMDMLWLSSWQDQWVATWKIVVLFLKYSFLCTSWQAQIRSIPRKCSTYPHCLVHDSWNVFISWLWDVHSENPAGYLLKNVWGRRCWKGCMDLLLWCLNLVMRHIWRVGHVMCKAWYCSDKNM